MTGHGRRLRLLVMLPFPPRCDGLTGGIRVTGQLLTRLAGRHDLGLLYFRCPGDAPIDQSLQRACVFAEEIEQTRTAKWRFQLAQLWGLARGQPLWATAVCSKQFANRAASLCQMWQPDILQIDTGVMGQYLGAVRNNTAPRLLVEHEPAVVAARDMALQKRAGQRWLAWLDLLAWRRFEPGVLRLVDAVVAFSERDRKALRHAAIHVIPLAVTIPAQALNPVGACPPRLIFVGSFDHQPNVDAALRLASSIFPSLKARWPDLTLQIVGDRVTPEVRALAGSGVEVTGRVPDVNTYLEAASVVVVPIRFGGGMRVKVMEALAAGKAVVASPLAAEGLAIGNTPPLLLAEDDHEFVDAAASLLESPERRVALATHARRWAREHLSWDERADAYTRLYDELLANCRRQAHSHNWVARTSGTNEAD